MAASRCLRCNVAASSPKRQNLLTTLLSACLTQAPRRGFREIYDDSGSISQKKVSSDEVNKRIFENEFLCFPRNKCVGFTANQLGVNRPVEDRWSAYRIGGAMCFDMHEGFYNSLHPMAPFSDEFSGGHLFTVVDGHAGHTCAHAVNMLHADYVTAALAPQHLVKPIYNALSQHDFSRAPPQASELAQPYLMDPCAVMTSSADDPDSATGPFAHDDRYLDWRLWGQWGPLDAQVNQRRLSNIHLMLKERFLTTNCDAIGDCVLHANGNVYDGEGFLVSEGSEFPSADLQVISAMASALRTGLARMDTDITADAVPHPERGLNKSLLRIVLSGCVATSIFIPADFSSIYVLQVGDCGAVMGRYLGQSKGTAEPTVALRKKFHPADWSAELLVPPHNASNVRDVERLQSQHPIHEASLMIVEDRLLCELIPLRAFGDIRYKMPAKILQNIARLCGLPPNYPVTPRLYTSPPYLFSTPQVVCRRLDKARDLFVILATDGLWDMLTPEQAVNVVAQHYIDYKGNPSNAGPRDTAASRLIRTALGGHEMDTSRIAMHLSVPSNMARFYRDDITVQVVYPTRTPS
ncbi:unnamed protein product [Mesocestoides corti]|uniref:PPM-type phosphatase domain-containing protein n=2 Tax=Mesocestoides corti TaxID=53468 RepID=A0A158QUI7_MESCO|nr:unnamed protein product [Mesocestoides corti]